MKRSENYTLMHGGKRRHLSEAEVAKFRAKIDALIERRSAQQPRTLRNDCAQIVPSHPLNTPI